MKIKTQTKKVMFNMSERDLCKKCAYPEGFCKHTIKNEYKEMCPDTPLNQEGIWQIVRDVALERTFHNRLEKFYLEDSKKFKNENDELKEEIKELRIFKKHVKQMLNN